MLELPQLSPMHFFALSLSCFQIKDKELSKKHILPDLSDLHQIHPFAEVAMGWSEEGILIHVMQKKRIFSVHFPDFHLGDAMEIFLDTRDVKTTGYNTRFCHHFCFLPEAPQEGIQSREITHFRGEETRELCDPNLLEVQTLHHKGNSITKIYIPKEALYGYEPLLFQRIGFTYRILHQDGKIQDFSCNSKELPIEQQPSVWASLKLIAD